LLFGATMPYRETEYLDGVDYDRRNPWLADDDFYLALAQRLGGPVLDLGCGTGRLARALAATGLDVTAVDVSPAMLARARALDLDGRVRYSEGDIRDLRLDRRFGLALMTGHGFQHLLSDADQRRALDRIAALLRPGGCFAFDLRNLAAQDFTALGRFRPSDRFTDPAGCEVSIEAAPHWDEASGIATYYLRRRFDGRIVGRSKARLRYSEPAALERLLAESGFTVEARYGDWPDRPFRPDSPELITLCRVRGSAA
jgi:SAM-dependent methyltransferase